MTRKRKYLVAHCELCPTAKTFAGRDVKAISKLIDSSGWRDAPKGDGIGFVCSSHTDEQQVREIISWIGR